MEQKKDKIKKTYEVTIDYPSEIIQVEADSKEEACDKALQCLGEQTIIPEKRCTATAEEVKE
jgi:hypothetical protein